MLKTHKTFIILSMVRSAHGAPQIWAIIEANTTFNIYSNLANFDNNKFKRLYLGGYRFSFTSPLKLIYTWDIGGPSPNSTLKNKMGQVSMGQGIAVLTEAMFNVEDQS